MAASVPNKFVGTTTQDVSSLDANFDALVSFLNSGVDFQGAELVSSYAAIRALTASTTSTTLAFTTGRLSMGDGGMGWFRADPSDTTSADNDGTILVAADGMRWKRLYDGEVNAAWFGAVGDGVTDSGAAIQAAINLGPNTVLLPDDHYITTVGLDLSPNGKSVRLVGGGSTIRGGTNLAYTGPDTLGLEVIKCGGTDTAAVSGPIIENMRVSTTAVNVTVFSAAYTYNIVTHNCFFSGGRIGTHLLQVWDSHFHDTYLAYEVNAIAGQGAYGLLIESSAADNTNSVSFSDCVIEFVTCHYSSTGEVDGQAAAVKVIDNYTGSASINRNISLSGCHIETHDVNTTLADIKGLNHVDFSSSKFLANGVGAKNSNPLVKIHNSYGNANFRGGMLAVYGARFSITGDTDGSTAVVTSIASTVGVVVGSYVDISGGFSAPQHLVLSKTATTVTLDTNSTSVVTGAVMDAPYVTGAWDTGVPPGAVIFTGTSFVEDTAIARIAPILARVSADINLGNVVGDNCTYNGFARPELFGGSINSNRPLFYTSSPSGAVVLNQRVENTQTKTYVDQTQYAVQSAGNTYAGTNLFYINTNSLTPTFAIGTNFAALVPKTDNVTNLGGPGERWTQLYAGTATINTSDEREKDVVLGDVEKEKRVAVAIKGAFCKFKFKAASEKKGEDKARLHFGIMAQTVEQLFKDQGLDPARYGLFCKDEYEENGEQKDRYGVRYEELFAFLIARS